MVKKRPPCPTYTMAMSSEVVNADSGSGALPPGLLCGGAHEGRGHRKVWGRCLLRARKPLGSVWAVSVLVTALVVLGWTFQTALFLAF